MDRRCTARNNILISFALVESVYLANLTLNMLTSTVMVMVLQLSKQVFFQLSQPRDKFAVLFNDEMVGEEDRQELMAYVVGKYANMRGTYFAKHLKDNSGNHVVSGANLDMSGLPNSALYEHVPQYILELCADLP